MSNDNLKVSRVLNVFPGQHDVSKLVQRMTLFAMDEIQVTFRAA